MLIAHGDQIWSQAILAEATLGASKIRCPEDDGAFAQQALKRGAARLDAIVRIALV